MISFREQNNCVRLSRLVIKEIIDLRITSDYLSKYLSKLYGEPVNLLGVWELGDKKSESFLKNFGYGVPYVIKFNIKNKVKKMIISLSYISYISVKWTFLGRNQSFSKVPNTSAMCSPDSVK